MKIVVFSDSHGNTDSMVFVVRKEKPDYLIHLGDYARDVDLLRIEFPFLPILQVRGNCDLGDFLTPDTAEAVYNGVRVFATHGHIYGVKSSLLRLYMAAKEKAARIVLFGHTHCAICEQKDDLLLLNPGSCRHGHNKTYAVINLKGEIFDCEIKSIEQGE